jgi:hypothetical protein
MITLEQFSEELKNANTGDLRLRFLRKHVFHGLPIVFNANESEYFEFRQMISEKFKVAYHEVFIVGSAKLGFSYTKQTIFSYDSDVDVVILNEGLFENYYKNICEYQYMFEKFRKIPSSQELQKYNEFLQYLVKGWMRPDLLPYSFQVDVIKTEWFEFFKSISYGKTSIGNYKVNAGLFKNNFYLEKYYLNGIEKTFQLLTK